ncbi:hypothetical protein BGZ61DRAFT_101765 [Ilyonectria robusta]|uniref:uncharacterized protein n=1 Tax=Ilyonectria robusta TaxID=1079257 RepID=UPI001E8E42DF|nr:uncharacterized protein BGZ61DRAFT_101765 [Ilyonectria robusta]KAH8672981.1 hypothetical protein BGZ61DRAFT_101765 [Ilyonectria robusta]
MYSVLYIYNVLYNVLCHVPPHTDYPGHLRQGVPSPPFPPSPSPSPKTWVLSCKCNCVVVPETAIGIAQCILVHSHSGHRPSGCSLRLLLSVLSRFPSLHLDLSSSWHIVTLARRLGQPRCSRSSVNSRVTSQGAPDAPPRPRLLARSHSPPLLPVACTRAIPMAVRSTSRPTVPRQERTHHPPGIRCVRPMALAPLDILEA